MKNLTNDFIALNQVLENIQLSLENVSDSDKEKIFGEFFGVRNKVNIMTFIDGYIPVRHERHLN